MLRLKISLVVFALSIMCLSSGLQASVPELDVPFTASAPKIDGVVNDSEWETSAVIPEFVDIVTGKNTTPETSCRVAQDADNLYIACVCYDDDVANLVQKIKTHDYDVWMDDCVEIFLDPQGTRKNYFHFIVNPAGAKYDDFGRNEVWDRYWDAKTSIGKDFWSVEIRIPFSSLEIRAKSPASASWTANFYRTCQARSNRSAMLSGWSPTKEACFAVPEFFGKLNGVKVNGRDYCPGGEVFVTAPERWVVGNNKATLRIPNETKNAYNAELACIDIDSGKKIASRLITVKPGPQTAGISIPIKEAGSYNLQFLVIDGKSSRRVLGSSRVVKADVVSGFKTMLAYPCFRNSFQSRDPKKEICVKGFVGFPNASGMEVQAVLKSGTSASSVMDYSIAVSPQSDFILRSPITLPPAGDYTLALTLTDAAHKILATAKYPIHVLASASFEVTFDENHICYVNGQPVFPIGLYHTSSAVIDIVNNRSKEIGLPGNLTVDAMLQDVKDHGFNTVFSSWGMASQDYLQKAQNLGLFVVPEVGSASADQLTDYVMLANKFNNLLMWYGQDEISDATLPGATVAYDRFCKIDPHRPASAAICFQSQLKNGAGVFDFIMTDPYIIGNANTSGDLAGLGENWVQTGLAASDGRYPLWGVPQGFTVSAYNLKLPTAEQLCCQAYEYIANGATGLMWYSYWSPEPYRDNPAGRNGWYLPESPLWPAFKELNTQIQSFTKIVLHGRLVDPKQYSIKSSSCNMSSRIWDYNGWRYILAVNAYNQPLDAAFYGKVSGRIQVAFENRILKPNGNGFKDHFEPLAVHIYKFKP